MTTKAIITLGLVTAILSTLIGYHVVEKKKAYDSGYNTARLEMFEQFQDDLDIAMKHKEEKLNLAILESNKWKKKAIELQNREPVTVTEKEVVEIVKTNTDCKRIVNLPKLLNKLTEANFAD